MKITFENSSAYMDKARSYESTKAQNKIGGQQAYSADISGIVTDNEAYTVHGRTMRDVMQEAQSIDVTAQQDYLTVMSHSMSGEDFGKMLKEGVDPTSCDVETSVTILDKIKAEVAKSGVSISGFNDDIDPEVLKEITGSESYANHLVNSMKEADVPVTKENVKEADEAVKRAVELTPLSEGELKFMALNNLEPTIDNLYLAKHSGAVDADRQSKGYFAEGMGYFAKKADEVDTNVILPQIKDFLTQIGEETNEENIGEATWLVEKGIALTEANFESLNEVKNVNLPVSEKEAVERVVTAMSDYRPALKTNLSKDENRYELATGLEARVEALINDSATSVHDRRILEETRLKMTAEVNVKLIESGFSLDTSDLEAFVDALKAAEEKVAKRYFPESNTEEAVSNKQLLDETISRRNALYEMPASALGSLIFERKETVTVDNLYDEGAKHKNALDQAKASYETLMTAPRADLGDSIKKAFRNVDDLLDNIGAEATERNRRGVRILAYNHVEITEENLERIVEADRRVNRVVERMNPATTLKMIRDGINPLKTSFEDLETYFKELNDDPERQMETYSRYLYNLEQSGKITEDERTAYIGVYRMLRQIEKSDGAVIGRVLEAGRELNFSNLLSAARIAKRAGMDILVDDEFGGLKDLVYRDVPIDVQVSAGEQRNDYIYRQTFEEFRQAEAQAKASSEEDIEGFLKQADLAPTLSHIKEALEGKADSKKAWNKLNRFAGKAELESFSKGILDAFTGRDEALKAYEAEADALKERISEDFTSPELTSIDVREMKSSYIFLSVAVGMARQETYEIPMSADDNAMSIRLTIRHDGENKGNALVTIPSEELGDVSVSFTLDGNEAEGFLICEKDDLEKRENLNNLLNIAFEKDDISFRNLLYTRKYKAPEKGDEKDKIQNESTYRIYKAAKTVVEAMRQVF